MSNIINRMQDTTPYNFAEFDELHTWFIWPVRINKDFKAAFAVKSGSVKFTIYEYK